MTRPRIRFRIWRSWRRRDPMPVARAAGIAACCSTDMRSFDGYQHEAPDWHGVTY